MEENRERERPFLSFRLQTWMDSIVGKEGGGGTIGTSEEDLRCKKAFHFWKSPPLLLVRTISCRYVTPNYKG